MPGFGTGPFGGEPFGEYHWSRKVFYDLMPEAHREQDRISGQYLDKFVEGERASWDYLRRKMRAFSDLRDPLTCRTQYDEVVTITTGAVVNETTEFVTVEVRSVDSGSFGILDIGPGWVFFDGYSRIEVLARRTFDVLGTPLTYPELDLSGVVVPRGIIEKSGSDGQVTLVGPPGRFYSATANFEASDVGKYLQITDPTNPANNGYFKITSLVSPFEVDINAGPLVLAAGLAWNTRQGTGIFGLSPWKAQVYSPSMLQYLAQDFAISVDEQESERRQISWVRNNHQWIGKKGTARGYYELGRVSGFDVSTFPLYRINIELYDWIFSVLGSGAVYEVGYDLEPGLSGTNGKLEDNGDGRLRFSSATGTFREAYIGNHIRILTASYPGNVKLFTVEEVVDSTTVIFRYVDTPGTTVPDPISSSVPNLSWRMVRLYTDRPPYLPLFDDIRADELEVLIGVGDPPNPHFKLDSYCWEPGFDTEVPITVLGWTLEAPNLYRVVVSGNADVAVTAGHWIFEDRKGDVFVMERRWDYPALTSSQEIVQPNGGNWDFFVKASSPPVVGPDAKIYYDCPEVLRCSYCAASKIAVVLTTADITTETGSSLERVVERVMARIAEAVPAHVEVLLILRYELEATLSIMAHLEDWTAYGELTAPFTAYYDEISGDEIVTDTTIYATVTGPFSPVP